MKSVKTIVILLSSVLLLPAFSHGNIIASWTYDNPNTGDFFPIAATSTAPGVTASASLGAGLSHPSWLNNNGILAVGATLSTLDAALNANDYFSFSISGSTMSFDGLTAYVASQGETVDRDFYLFSDVTGFGSGDVIDSVKYSGPGFAGSQGSLWEVDLSGITDLHDVTGTVEFRIYSTATGATDSQFLGFRENAPTPDIQFTGVIPEPSTYAAILGVLALAGAVLRRSLKK